jgi:uncharacterized protein (DUF1697 family)
LDIGHWTGLPNGGKELHNYLKIKSAYVLVFINIIGINNMQYVALLRGINVGKSVQVPMKRLKSLLESFGYANVNTYLNSGNVIFDSTENRPNVIRTIESSLKNEFGQLIPTLVKTAEEIISIKNSIPAEWENDQTQQTYIAYLFNDIAKPELIDELPIKRQYMEIFYAHEAIIWNIKRKNYNKSQITKIANHSAYERMTTRNVNTARKLAELCSNN